MGTGATPTPGRPQEDALALRRENERLLRANAALERQVVELSTFVVVAQRLRDAMGQGEVLAVVEEVLAAIVGTEQFALYALEAGGASLRRLAACGVSFDPAHDAELLAGPLGAVARSGQTWVAERPEAEGLAAGVPLLLGRRVIGVIAIFKLLPQKVALAPADRELFTLLARHAGVALCASGEGHA